MVTGIGDPKQWAKLGRLAYERRKDLRLTQEQLAKRLGVGLGTITRLEAGVQVTRRATSWPRIEAGFGWPEGFIEDFVTGKILGLPESMDDEGRFTRQRKSVVTDIVRDLVRMITLEVAPDTSISKVLELEEQAIAFARERSAWVPPDVPSTSDDVPIATNP